MADVTQADAGPTEIVMAVVQRQDQICLARRSHSVATSRGLWSVVTGYLEPGIDPTAQVWQELDEELGFRSPAVRLVHALAPLPLTSAASGKRFLLYSFLFEADEQCDPVLNWEHTEVAWVFPDRLNDADCVAWQHAIVLALLESHVASRCPEH